MIKESVSLLYKFPNHKVKLKFKDPKKNRKAAIENFRHAFNLLKELKQQLVSGFKIAFPDSKEYIKKPLFFVQEMCALLLWGLAAETDIPTDNTEKRFKRFLKIFGTQINPEDYYSTTWWQSFTNCHKVIQELEKLELMGERSHGFVNDEIHREKCYLDEADDLIIASWAYDKKEIGSELLPIVQNCYWNMAISYYVYDGELKKSEVEALDNLKIGLTDIPPKNYIKIQDALKPRILEEVISDLMEMVGLQDVKREIVSAIQFNKIQKERLIAGLKCAPISRHMVFLGNPGTGKTTIARLISEAYKSIGLLRKGHLVEVDREGLVAGYVGQTALKTKELIEKAMGGVLFIDEAYSLTNKGNENDFGREALETIIKAMEDKRDDLIVIVAGYENEMQDFLETNPGLVSRFGKIIEFPDYSSDELVSIFFEFLKKNDYLMGEEAGKKIQAIFKDISLHSEKGFGNARYVRNFFEKIIENQANRLALLIKLEKESLLEILPEDIPDCK